MAKKIWRVEKGKLHLGFHEGQARAWRCKRRFVFVLAGTQSGKTSFGPWWLEREIRNTADPAGGNDYIAATATYDLFRLKMLPELTEVFQDTLGIGRWWASSKIFELKDPATGKFWAKSQDDRMWGRIILRAASSPGGLESASAKGAWIDECGQDEFTVQSWEAILRRLSLSQGRVLGSTTPYNLGWLKTEAYDKWVEGDQDFAIIQFASHLNPAFPMAEYLRAKRTMPAWRFQMFYDGLLGRPANLIYDCYNDAIGGNLVEDFPIPANWPRYVGGDFGAINTCLVWVAQNPRTGVFYVYRVSLQGSKTTAEHCREALELAAHENVVAWYGGAPSETQQRMDWNNEGVPIQQPLIADVEGGIMRPYGLVKRKQMYIFRSCTGIRDELGSYKRKLDASGQPTAVIENKRKYHHLDSLRYVSSGLTEGKVVTVGGFW